MGRPGTRRWIGRVAVQGVVFVALVVGGAVPAFAAKPTGTGHGGGGGGGGGGTATATGNDISYPQCGSSFPSAPAFGIVGVNGGVASDLNPCLGPSSSYPNYTESELYWAVAASVGGTTQPKASLYVNTGDPGNVYNGTVIGDWPTTSVSGDPYGSCTTTTVTLTSGTYLVGQNSDGCAWQYGYNMATQDAGWLSAAASAIDGQESSVSVAGTASSYPWWLDVETGNTWQSDTTMNVADLQGMIAGLTAAGVNAATIGVYSTSSQWNTITGGTSSASGSLYGIANWIPGARGLSGAEANCTQASFTGGKVVLTQWFGHPVDGDYAC